MNTNRIAAALRSLTVQGRKDAKIAATVEAIRTTQQHSTDDERAAWLNAR